MSFDQKAKEYDAWYLSPIGAFVDARETECAMSILPLNLGKNLLDLGCGTGRFSMKMSLLGYHMTGIDLSEPMLDIARAKAEYAHLNATFYKMNACHLDFPDETFDGVVSMALYEFIHDDKAVFEECLRVTKPGGYIMIGTITANSSWGKMYQSQMYRADSVFHHAHFKTQREMENIYPEYLQASKSCVFIPPTHEEGRLTLEEEVKYSQTEIGAFTCLLWQKPKI